MKTYCIPLILVLLLSSLLLFIGCANDQEREKNVREYNQFVLDSAEILLRDGCEYISGFGHKGDCKNPKHYFKRDENIFKYNIVLPEEYPLVSTDSNRPDTFTAYASRDTIYFQFDNLRNR